MTGEKLNGSALSKISLTAVLLCLVAMALLLSAKSRSELLGLAAPYAHFSVADIPGHSVGEIDDLKLELVAARTKLPVSEFVHLLRQPGEGCFPTGILLVDGAPMVGAKGIWKARNT